MFTMALSGGIVSCYTLKIIFRSIEFKRWAMHAGWKSSEFQLSIRVGAGFEIEPVESAESVRDVHFHLRSINRLSIRTIDGQLQRAWSCSTIYGRNLLCFRFRT